MQDIPETPSVFYACGSDLAENCSLYFGMSEPLGVVVVPREGEHIEKECPDKNVFVAEPAGGELASFSSTKVRAALDAQDTEYLSKALSPEAATFLLNPGPADLERFSDDYACF